MWFVEFDSSFQDATRPEAMVLSSHDVVLFTLKNARHVKRWQAHRSRRHLKGWQAHRSRRRRFSVLHVFSDSNFAK
jgi:hypothetical protein